MTQIIGFAGKKQSGKNTCCNFITMLKLIENGVCKRARLDENGEIEVSDIFGETLFEQEYFSFKKPIVNTDAVLQQIRAVKVYALADPLKRIAIDVLGLPEEKVYGTDKDKNELTDFYWENMPGVVSNTTSFYVEGVDSEFWNNIIVHKNGQMTVREVLQYLGTDIFRHMHSKVWVDSLFRQIEKDNMELALVCDVRFDNEIEAIKNKDSIVIGLKRDVSKKKDKHSSENVNLNLCDAIIDNSNMDFSEQNKQVYLALKTNGCNNLTDLGVV
jgi:hypothetical protein